MKGFLIFFCLFSLGRRRRRRRRRREEEKKRESERVGFLSDGFGRLEEREEAVSARFLFGECLETSLRCSDDFEMDAFKSENGSEIGTSSVTDDVLIRRRFEAKEPDKTLVFWSIFWDVFDARTRCERAPGVSRRRGRLESARDEAQGPARASALLRDFLRRRAKKIRISYILKKCHLSVRVLCTYEGDARAERRPHSFGSNPSALLIL